MPQKQPPSQDGRLLALVGARGASTEGFGIVRDRRRHCKRLPRPSGRTAARVAKARNMNRSMTTLLSRWYDISFLSDTISPYYKADRQEWPVLPKPRATMPPTILRVACSFVGARWLDALNDFFHDLARLFWPLTGHSVSFTRHWERVPRLHPQVQLSAFRRCRAAFFCAGVNPVRFTPGNSVAFTPVLTGIVGLCPRRSQCGSSDRKSEKRAKFQRHRCPSDATQHASPNAPLRIDYKGSGPRPGTPPYADA